MHMKNHEWQKGMIALFLLRTFFLLSIVYLLLLFYGQLVFILHLFSCTAHLAGTAYAGLFNFYLHITLDIAAHFEAALFLVSIEIFQLCEWI